MMNKRERTTKQDTNTTGREERKEERYWREERKRKEDWRSTQQG
jgi:hypothetical protein